MPSAPSFGNLDSNVAVEAPKPETPLRIAVLGDFSGRVSRSETGTPEEIAARKPYLITHDNFDDIFAKLGVRVKLTLEDGDTELSLASFDDFEPDQIHDHVEKFSDSNDDDDKTKLMKTVLHQPGFQSVESAWRGLDWMMRRAQKGTDKVDVMVYDLTQAELAVVLNAGDDLSACALREPLFEHPTKGPKGQPLSLMVGLYRFDMTVADVQLLGRMAKLSRLAAAPFLAGVVGRVLAPDFAPDAAATDAWQALRQLPEACMLGLALPGFLLRPPFGSDTKSIDRFSFEEYSGPDDKAGYLWGNASLISAALAAQAFVKQGWAFKPGAILDVDSMPMHAFVEDDEEMLTLAEAWLTKPAVEKLGKFGLMPLLCVRDRNALQVFRYQSLAQPPKDKPASDLLGRWGQKGMVQLPRSTSKMPLSVGVGVGSSTAPPPAAPAAAAAPAAESAEPARAAPAPAEAAGDPELDALMKQLEGGGAPAAAPPADAAQAEGSGDPELDALMKQLEGGGDTPAPAAAAPAEGSGDPELDALMKQLEGGGDAPAAPAAAPPAEEGSGDPELDALMKQLEGG